MTKAFLVIKNGSFFENGRNLSKTQVKEQALKELKASFDEYGEPCVCVVFDKDNKGIYLGSANERGAKIVDFYEFADGADGSADSLSYTNSNKPEWDSVEKALNGIIAKIDCVEPKNSADIDTSNFALKAELDEFDTGAYKQELQAIANEVTNKMAVFDELTELDLNELKAQLKAEILAELKGTI